MHPRVSRGRVERGARDRRFTRDKRQRRAWREHEPGGDRKADEHAEEKQDEQRVVP
jgi:hypothetical protein